VAGKGIVPVRGYLLHLTHYDPLWYSRKSNERPIDLGLALEIIDLIADTGFNLLIIDCADAVKYKSHPELRRRYSLPQAVLRRLVMRAQLNDIEVVPKLNFSQTAYYKHNYWMRPYNRYFDTERYWKVAFDLIDELIRVCRPANFFHIGMDEDHERSHPQYIKAILRLRQGLKQRGLRTIIWNDSPHKGFATVHARKSMAAEKKIPKDIVQLIWDYRRVPPRHIQRLINLGFEVWGAPGWNPQHAFAWKQAILRYGGNGLIMTRWIPCQRTNRTKLLRLIGTAGPVYCAKHIPAIT
jgi:hypothetical protein